MANESPLADLYQESFGALLRGVGGFVVHGARDAIIGQAVSAVANMVYSGIGATFRAVTGKGQKEITEQEINAAIQRYVSSLPRDVQTAARGSMNEIRSGVKRELKNKGQRVRESLVDVYREAGRKRDDTPKTGEIPGTYSAGKKNAAPTPPPAVSGGHKVSISKGIDIGNIKPKVIPAGEAPPPVKKQSVISKLKAAAFKKPEPPPGKPVHVPGASRQDPSGPSPSYAHGVTRDIGRDVATGIVGQLNKKPQALPPAGNHGSLAHVPAPGRPSLPGVPLPVGRGVLEDIYTKRHAQPVSPDATKVSVKSSTPSDPMGSLWKSFNSTFLHKDTPKETRDQFLSATYGNKTKKPGSSAPNLNSSHGAPGFVAPTKSSSRPAGGHPTPPPTAGRPLSGRIFRNMDEELGGFGVGKIGAGVDAAKDYIAKNPGKTIGASLAVGAIVAAVAIKIASIYKERNRTISDEDLRADIDGNLYKYLKGTPGEQTAVARAQVDPGFRRNLVSEIYATTRPKIRRPGEKTALGKAVSSVAGPAGKAAGEAIQAGLARGAREIVHSAGSYAVNRATGGRVSRDTAYDIISGGKSRPGTPNVQFTNPTGGVVSDRDIRNALRTKENLYTKGQLNQAVRDAVKQNDKQAKKDQRKNLPQFPETPGHRAAVERRITQMWAEMSDAEQEEFDKKYPNDSGYTSRIRSQAWNWLKRNKPDSIGD